MLREIGVRQIESDPKRKWYSSDYFDLIVWFNEKNEIMGFQLCYDKERTERALTWTCGGGYTHGKVDSGETRPGKHKGTPVVMEDGIFEKERIGALFMDESREMDRAIADPICERILAYGETTA